MITVIHFSLAKNLPFLPIFVITLGYNEPILTGPFITQTVPVITNKNGRSRAVRYITEFDYMMVGLMK
jgi:hypothetical protein